MCVCVFVWVVEFGVKYCNRARECVHVVYTTQYTQAERRRRNLIEVASTDFRSHPTSVVFGVFFFYYYYRHYYYTRIIWPSDVARAVATAARCAHSAQPAVWGLFPPPRTHTSPRAGTWSRAHNRIIHTHTGAHDHIIHSYERTRTSLPISTRTHRRARAPG